MKFAIAATCLMAYHGVLGFTSSITSTRKTSYSSSSNISCDLMVDGRNVDGEVKAANNFILVKVANSIEKTDGGILLTGTAKIQKTEGTVVSVGPGKTHPETGEPFEMPVTEGEGVVYGKYDGTEIEIDGAKHSLIRDEDILVKFSGETLTLESANVVRDSVLVYVEQKESTTEGGLVLSKSKSTENKPSTGKVVKVGPGVFGSDMNVAEGDNVKFRDFAGNEIELDGEEYSVVRMADILAKY